MALCDINNIFEYPLFCGVKQESPMKMHEVRQIAKKWGVDIKVGRSKQDIIRDIQVKEGYSPCYRTKEECEYDCLWKTDCLNP